MAVDEKYVKLLFDLKLPANNVRKKSFKRNDLKNESAKLQDVTDTDLSFSVPKCIQPFSISMKKCSTRAKKYKEVKSDPNTKQEEKKKKTGIKPVLSNNETISLNPYSPSLSIDSAIDLSADHMDVFDQCYNNYTETSSNNCLSEYDSFLSNYSCSKEQLPIVVDEITQDDKLLCITRPNLDLQLGKNSCKNIISESEYSSNIPILIETVINDDIQCNCDLESQNNKHAVSGHSKGDLECKQHSICVPRSQIVTEKIQQIEIDQHLFQKLCIPDMEIPIFLVPERKRFKYRSQFIDKNTPSIYCVAQNSRSSLSNPDINQDLTGLTYQNSGKDNSEHNISDIFNVEVPMDLENIGVEISPFEPSFVSNAPQKDTFTECLANLVSDANSVAPATHLESSSIKSLKSANSTSDSDYFNSVPLEANVAIRTMNFIVESDDQPIPEGLKKLLPVNNDQPCTETNSNLELKNSFNTLNNASVVQSASSFCSTMSSEEQCKSEYKFNIALLRSISFGILQKKEQEKRTLMSSSQSFDFKGNQGSPGIKLCKAKDLVAKSKHILRRKRLRQSQTW